jgi:hypothetical protein
MWGKDPVTERTTTQPGSYFHDAVHATRFLRRVRGGSQSSLFEASDGACYVVKFLQNPQGERVCFNEALGALLAEQLCLPFQPSKAIFVSEQLCSQDFLRYEGEGVPPIKPGLHFASLVPEGCDVFENLPRSWSSKIRNRQDFLSVLLFDIWATHVDNRQALFIMNADLSITASFFDNGHLFGGPRAEVDRPHQICGFLDVEVYEGLDISASSMAVFEKIVSLSKADLNRILAEIPEDWMHSGVGRVIDKLLERRSKVEQIIGRMRGRHNLFYSVVDPSIGLPSRGQYGVLQAAIPACCLI